MANSDSDAPLPLSKLVEENDLPLGREANSPEFYDRYDAIFMHRVSDAEVWPYDPEEDIQTMHLLHQGLEAQYDRSLPSPAEAAGYYSAALRRRKDFARAWLNLAVARAQLRELDAAAQILKMLITRAEQTGEWQMSRGARNMLHHNSGTVNLFKSQVSQGSERMRYLEEADREFAMADELNHFADTGDLFTRLIVQIELDNQAGAQATVERLKKFISANGESARELAKDYITKYPHILSGAAIELLPEGKTQ